VAIFPSGPWASFGQHALVPAKSRVKRHAR